MIDFSPGNLKSDKLLFAFSFQVISSLRKHQIYEETHFRIRRQTWKYKEKT